MAPLKQVKFISPVNSVVFIFVIMLNDAYPITVFYSGSENIFIGAVQLNSVLLFFANVSNNIWLFE